MLYFAVSFVWLSSGCCSLYIFACCCDVFFWFGLPGIAFWPCLWPIWLLVQLPPAWMTSIFLWWFCLLALHSCSWFVVLGSCLGFVGECSPSFCCFVLGSLFYSGSPSWVCGCASFVFYVVCLCMKVVLDCCLWFLLSWWDNLLTGLIVAGCGLLVVLLVFLGVFPLGFVLYLLLVGCLLQLLVVVYWDLFLHLQVAISVCCWYSC